MAVGGGAQSALWLSMFADATGIEVTISRSLEASALGAGIIAAHAAGWYESFDAAAAAMSQTDRSVEPVAAHAEAWAALADRRAAAYNKGF